MGWFDWMRPTPPPALPPPPAPEPEEESITEAPPDPLEDVHWLEQGVARDLLYSIADILGALAGGHIQGFGLYDIHERKIVLPVTDRSTALLAARAYRPEKYVFAYRLNDQHVLLYMVVAE